MTPLGEDVPKVVADEETAYRSLLLTLWQKSQEEFDKAVLSLSGGALGVSFVFLKDIVGTGPVQKRGLLLAAWACWGTSSLGILFSYLTSKWALWNCICTLDTPGNVKPVPPQKSPQSLFVRCLNWLGVSWQDRMTTLLNSSAAVLFLAGLILMISFVGYNLEALNRDVQKSEPTSNATPAATATPAVTATSPTDTK